MAAESVEMGEKKRIALVAHDQRKADLIEWALDNKEKLSQHHILATGGTGAALAQALGLPVQRLLSGPLGGDQQLGSRIAEAEIDVLVFFWDPLEAQPHEPDVKALLRLAVLYNIPTASNRASADFLLSSPLFESSYVRVIPDFASRIGR